MPNTYGYGHAIPVEANSITADVLLKTASSGNPVRVFTISLAAGSDTATLTLYDNTVGSGEVEWSLVASANTTASVTFPDTKPLRFNTGLYADISGTSARASIQFD